MTTDTTLLQSWVEKVTETPFTDPKNLHTSLKNGVQLSLLICKILGKKTDLINLTPNTTMKEMNNIEFFQKECKNLGMNVIWKVRDLHAGKDLNGVIASLIELEKKASSVQTFKGPFLKDLTLKVEVKKRRTKNNCCTKERRTKNFNSNNKSY